MTGDGHRCPGLRLWLVGRLVRAVLSEARHELWGSGVAQADHLHIHDSNSDSLNYI